MLNHLTGLRGILALWVLLLHYSYGLINQPFSYLPTFSHKTDWGALTNIISWGHFAVDLFFLLSGFIISYAYSSKLNLENHSLDSIKKYLWNRMARIYPLYLFASLLLIVSFYLGIWRTEHDISPSIAFLNVTLLNFLAHPSINMPAAAVSAEFFAYVTFPLLNKWLPNFKTRLPYFMILLFLPVIYGINYTVFGHTDWHYGSGVIFRVMICFITGIYIHKLYKNKLIFQETSSDFWFIGTIILLLCALFLELPLLGIYPILPFIILFLIYVKKDVLKFFSSRPLIYLGTISYSTYIMHAPISEIFDAMWRDNFEELDPVSDQMIIRVYLIFMVIMATALSAACFHLIENPARKKLKQI